MKILALITARGGSRRIPNKNIKLLGGKPLIWYTLQALRGTGVRTVALSTEDPMILSVANAYGDFRDCYTGGLIPIVRPAELAQDDTEHIDVLRHALAQFPTDSFDTVLTLQPTSPFRSRYHIDKALDVAWQKDKNDVYVLHARAKIKNGEYNEEIYKWPHFPILNTVSVNPDGVRNAAIYITPVSELAEPDRVKIYNPDSLTHGMDEISSLDINTPEDWARAEKILWNNPHLGI